ncbi:MAG: glucosamine-6-phosphate deaminase [Thermomicrobiales bacterium]
MDLIVTDDYASLSQAAAEMVAEVIAGNPSAAILAATGSTPMGLYQELSARHQRGAFDALQLRVVQLDEYLGIGANDHRSLYGWMLRAFVDPLGIPHGNVIRLPGDAPDPAAACRAYDEDVRQIGGIDLAILGLGPNGHLGFNEPPSAPDAPTRVVDLTEESIESNGRYWGGRDHVPRQAMTAGMATVLGARRVLLVVSGCHKRGILHRTLNEPVTPDVPASFLLTMPDVTVIADRDAWDEMTGKAKCVDGALRPRS